MTVGSASVTALVVTLAWGVLAFGSVYPWAYWPLALACFLQGAWYLYRRRPQEPVQSKVRIALVIILLALAIQLVPLPVSLIQRISPSTDGFLRVYDLSYSANVVAWRSLSISPSHTTTGILLFVAFGTLFAGLEASLTYNAVKRITAGIVGLGCILAITGIVQRAVFNGKIYGFWVPEIGLLPAPPMLSAFGPFVNRNHFAGWMLMAVPLALGYVGGLLAQERKTSKRDLRERILWLGSPSASAIIIAGFAIVLMTLSLVMTISRSGIASFVVAILLGTWAATRHDRLRPQRWIATTALMLLAVACAIWAGADAVVSRFLQTSADAAGRIGVWRDSLQIVRDFPLFGTGLNTFDTAILFYQRSHPDVHFAQAHNDYLQLAAEGGVLLAFPLLVTIFLFLRGIRRRLAQDRERQTNWLRWGAITGVVAICLQEVVEFSLQMPGNAALFAVLCAISLHSPKRFENRYVR